MRIWLLALAAAAGAEVPLPTDSVWTQTARAGSASEALQEAFAAGAPGVPWVRSAEYPGMREDWYPWAGLPLREAPEGADGLSGAGAPGPLAAAGWVVRATPSPDGVDRHAALETRTVVDTPVTALHFWRGALGSYRFGLGLQRAVLGPWDALLHVDTRSARSRNWDYRDQIVDLYGGDRTVLPATGQSPGQDDTRWGAKLRRIDSSSSAEIAVDWRDLSRAVPDPGSGWNAALDPWPARESVLGGSLAWERASGDWNVRLRAFVRDENWDLPAWDDTAGIGAATGEAVVSGAGGVFARAIGASSLELRLEGEQLSASDHGETVDRTPNERSGRLSIALESGAGALRSGLLAGSEVLSDGSRLLQGWTAEARGRAEAGLFAASATARHRSVLPSWNAWGRPDPLLLTRQSAGTDTLDPEDRWQIEGALEIGTGRTVSLFARGALLRIDHRVATLAPTGQSVADLAAALEPVNADQPVLGGSGDAGAGLRLGAWSLRGEVGLGWTGAPGEPLGGVRDRSVPALRWRAAAGWRDSLLGGRLRAESRFTLQGWSASEAWVPSGSDLVVATTLPASWNLTWENRFEIRTFGVFWLLENLGDTRQTVLPGWTPPGVRASWGVTWSFGG